eukprot:scaffold65801_cov66-Phaeocystis_antarctica.AAC.1
MLGPSQPRHYYYYYYCRACHANRTTMTRASLPATGHRTRLPPLGAVGLARVSRGERRSLTTQTQMCYYYYCRTCDLIATHSTVLRTEPKKRQAACSSRLARIHEPSATCAKMGARVTSAATLPMVSPCWYDTNVSDSACFSGGGCGLAATMVPEALARACAMVRSLAALARILAMRLSRLGAPMARCSRRDARDLSHCK